MKLLFDLYSTQPNATTRYHGGGIYGQTFFRELTNIDFWAERRVNVSVVVSERQPLPEKVAEAVSQAGAPVISVTGPGEILASAVIGDFDRLYLPVPYWLASAKHVPYELRIKGTVHGIRALDEAVDNLVLRYQRNLVKRVYRFSERFFLDRYLRDQKRNVETMLRRLNSGILTVSLHSKYQIVTEFPFVDANSVKVIPSIDAPPLEGNPKAIPSSVRQALAGRSYFLSLNANRPSKNVLGVVDALQKYQPRQFDSFAYICIGFTKAQQRNIQRKYPWVHTRIVHVPYCEREELEALLQGAFALLFPSVTEGFGYPPLEAMRNGIPALCACSTAVPETCGDSVLYFQPRIASEIVNRIVQIIEEPGLRERLIETGHRRYQQYHRGRPEYIREFGEFLVE